MTTGTFTFSPDNADLMTEAFERIGVRPADITRDHIRSALMSMELLLVEWSTKRAFKQYRFETITLNSTNYASEYIVGGASFVLPDRVQHIFTATYKIGNDETPIHFGSREEYLYTNDKTNTGRPNRYFYDLKQASPKLYIYPALDSASNSIILNVISRHEDAGNLADTPPVQYLWYEALAAGLGARLAEKYAPDREDKMIMKALAKYSDAEIASREIGSTRIKPKYC